MKKLSIGIDIGGINTVFGLVDEKGEFFGESTLSTKSYPAFGDYPKYVKDLSEALKAMLEGLDFEYEIVGMGIGAPNGNYNNNAIEQPANLWKYSDKDSGKDEGKRIFYLGEDLKKYMPEIPMFIVTNDANAATIGEMVFGNAKGLRDFFMVTLGTGLGSGFVANGEMIYGCDGFAGELGHITAIVGGRDCGCGKKGCLETYVSATGIKRTAFEIMAQMREPSPLRSVSFDDFDSALVSKAAAAGDPVALEIFRYTGEILGVALANASVIFSPEAIVLFGGAAKAGKLIFEPTKRYMEEHLLPTFKNQIDLLPSGIEDKNVAVLGAASLIWQKVN